MAGQLGLYLQLREKCAHFATLLMSFKKKPHAIRSCFNTKEFCVEGALSTDRVLESIFEETSMIDIHTKTQMKALKTVSQQLTKFSPYKLPVPEETHFEITLDYCGEFNTNATSTIHSMRNIFTISSIEDDNYMRMKYGTQHVDGTTLFYTISVCNQKSLFLNKELYDPVGPRQFANYYVRLLE